MRSQEGIKGELYEVVLDAIKGAWLDGYQCGQRLPQGVSPDHIAEEQAKYILAVLGEANG